MGNNQDSVKELASTRCMDRRNEGNWDRFPSALFERYKHAATLKNVIF